MKDRSKDLMLEAMNKLIRPLPKDACKSNTKKGEKNLLVIKKLRNWALTFILLIHIQIGKEVVKKFKWIIKRVTQNKYI